jgi:hypothetical protein
MHYKSEMTHNQGEAESIQIWLAGTVIIFAKSALNAG